MVDHLDATLAALAEPARRQVVELLRTQALSAGAIAARAGLTPAAMSRHLRVLRTAGLVEVDTPDDDARVRLYRLKPDRLVALGAWLDQVQAFWTEQLGSFKEHAERMRRSGGA
jgi:DNA-binding transcriptional ArsR family regulator